MARRRPGSASHTAQPSGQQPGLAVSEAAARVQELLRERARLTREAQKKRLQLEQWRERLAREAREAQQKMQPVVERHRVLVARLEELFRELLAPGRLSKRARAQVARLRRGLEFQGIVGPADDRAEPAEADIDDDEEEWEEPPPRRSRPGAAGRPGPEVAGAAQVGQERRSLRDIFRNLARAIHPDKARHEAERAERTEVMKQATRAYEDGDLARLIELESAWQRERGQGEAADPEQRCRELERVNRELLSQIRDLTRALRDLKREARGEFAGVPPDELLEQATQELDELEALCTYLTELGLGSQRRRR